MPQFAYIAMNEHGKEEKGRIECPHEEAAIKMLKEEMHLFPIKVKMVDKRGRQIRKRRKVKKAIWDISIGVPRIKRKELTVITRQLGTLLEAGLPLIRSLRTLEKQAKNSVTRQILSETADAVEEGATFSEALAYNPLTFNKLFLNMVRAGEAAGAMEAILNRLATFMEKAAKIAGKVKSAMIYPSAVLFFALSITAFLLVYIVPGFKDIFQELLGGKPLPWLPQFVIDCSAVLQEQGLLVLMVVVIFIALVYAINKTPMGKYFFDYIKYYMPVIGPVISKTAIARFSRTLGTLMAAGVPVLNALNIVRDTSGNELVAKAVQKVHDAVKEGEGIAGPLNATRVMPAMVISMMEVGEETGRLPDMLERIADKYEDDVDNAVDAMTSLIEPILIIFLALIVGTIVIALFMPLVSIIDQLSSGFGGEN